MNICQLAKMAEVSTDTVRYYEKQGLINAPERQDNDYRRYTEAHARAVRFVRGAQALGFSLAEIRAIVPQLAQGALGRTDIEQHLQTKMAQIDGHIQRLQTLKAELVATFASLRCPPHPAHQHRRRHCARQRQWRRSGGGAQGLCKTEEKVAANARQMRASSFTFDRKYRYRASPPRHTRHSVAGCSKLQDDAVR